MLKVGFSRLRQAFAEAFGDVSNSRRLSGEEERQSPPQTKTRPNPQPSWQQRKRAHDLPAHALPQSTLFPIERSSSRLIFACQPSIWV